MQKHVLRSLCIVSRERLCELAHELGYRFFEWQGEVLIRVNKSTWLHSGVTASELDH